jgi:hypothetical protein
MCLYFVTKVDASPILNKLRHAEKLSVSFLSSTKPGARLGDADVSRFTISEIITAVGASSICFSYFIFLLSFYQIGDDHSCGFHTMF